MFANRLVCLTVKFIVDSESVFKCNAVKNAAVKCNAVMNAAIRHNYRVVERNEFCVVQYRLIICTPIKYNAFKYTAV